MSADHDINIVIYHQLISKGYATTIALDAAKKYGNITDAVQWKCGDNEAYWLDLRKNCQV